MTLTCHLLSPELPHDPRRTVTEHSVTYHNLTKTDAQVLQCNATNKHGYIFANAFLNVLGKWRHLHINTLTFEFCKCIFPWRQGSPAYCIFVRFFRVLKNLNKNLVFSYLDWKKLGTYKIVSGATEVSVWSVSHVTLPPSPKCRLLH